MFININKGFSFFELIVSLAILAILVSIALPSFHAYKAKQELKLIESRLISINRYARSQSAVFRQNIVICPSTDFLKCQNSHWNNGFLVFIDQNRNRQVDDNEQILHIDKLNLQYGNLSWRGALGIPSLSYQAQSNLPIGSNGSFYYCSLHSSDHKRIFLSKMSMMRTEPITNC